MPEKIVKIGGASAFWGDTAYGARQLIEQAEIDYLVFDYLAEITMSLLARAKARKPDAGYAPDFVAALAPLLPKIAAKGIKVVSNAGGVNPLACRDALAGKIADAGLDLKIAVVIGDDVSSIADTLRAEDVREMATGAPMPEALMSANAYLGARPVAQALDGSADIVITGRCVDSAVTLGPLMHEFGWADTDYGLLSAGSLAGHLIECGPQVTGGLFTDWQSVPGWDDMGFPIACCSADGSFTLTKPEGTGGLVSPATVGEQLVYEIGDPRAYILPDVVCDWSGVRIEQAGADIVSVTGAKGRAPTPSYKVTATYPDGFRSIATMMIGGIDAKGKAQRVADALIARTRRLFAGRNLGDYRDIDIEILGAEATYGPHARIQNPREVVLKLAAHHDDKEALALFTREFLPSATSMAPGITGFAGGRPTVSPVVRLFSCLIDRTRVPVTVVDANGAESAVAVATGLPLTAGAPTDDSNILTVDGPSETVPLITLAHGRSGDKGDDANIGIIARNPDFIPLLRAALTEEAVADYFAHILTGPVERYELPGIHAFNFLMHGALGGGGIASLRYDPQGKAFAQMMLDMPIAVPKDWLAPGGLLAGAA